VKKNFFVNKKNNLVKISSLDPKNFIAPTWNFNFWFFSIDINSILEIKELILSQEKNIIENYPAFNDGGTGLGLDTVTSRYTTFNFFRIENSVVKDLKKNIGHQFEQYIKELKITELENYYPQINCWFNIMKPGQVIDSHCHNLTNTSFISGHVTVACENSFTYYITPYTKDKLEFTNNVGEAIFFPSYLEHGTSIHQGNDQRITLAFDIYYNRSQANHNIKNNLVDLYD